MNKSEMPHLRDFIQEKHQKFLSKMGEKVHLAMAQHLLDYEIVAAKLKYIASIMKEIGVIDEFVEHNVYAMERFFPCSITMGIKYPAPTVTVLNGGDELIIVNGVIKQDVISQAMHLSGEGTDSMKVFSGAISDTFDWKAFCNELLDFIYNVVYKRKQIIESLL